MEIIGIGTNVVECVRIGRLIEEHGEHFLDRVFTPEEIRRCRGRRGPAEHFAGQWAAKEAIVQCLGLRGGRAFRWTDVEARGDDSRRFTVRVGGAAKEQAQKLRVSEILVTIAHCRAYATAYAIAVRGPRGTGHAAG
jgi:holo-[acyl-carrier protein] synthase